MIKDGKVVRTVMRSFKLDEISGVDRPAQQGARVAIMKREAPLTKLQMSMALTTMTGGHAHYITMGGGEFVRRAGQTDYVDGHSHSWLMDEAGNVTVGHAMGHNHGIEIITKGSLVPDITSSEGEPAAADDATKSAGTTAAEAIGNHEDHEMTPEEKKAAEAAAAAQKADMEKMAKRVERAETISNLSDVQRSHFRLLKGEDAEAFLTASDTDRDETVRKAAEANQVVYTAMDGTTYRKNDDTRMINLAKMMDEEKKKRMLAEEKAKKSDLEKRSKDFAHLPGTDESRMSLLKALDLLPESEREGALSVLKAQDLRLSEAFKRAGTSAGGTNDEDNDLSPIDRLATEIAKRDNVTFERAYTKALGTPEGQKAYEQHVSRTRERV
jgi:hypothetical protein